MFHPSIQMGAALADAVSNAPFDADAWTQIGEELDDQRVPGSEFVSNFITECQKRLPMALMNIIDICCTTNVEVTILINNKFFATLCAAILFWFYFFHIGPHSTFSIV